MLLVLDIGNSNVTAGLSRDSAWLGEWRLATDVRRTADEYGLLLASLLRRDGIEIEEISHAVLSSVVPGLGSVMADMARSTFALDPIILGPGVRTGLEIVYDPPDSLGSDRLAACLAARERFGAPVIVVDFGTATTISVVDRRSRFIGGVISPGVGITADALALAGARLRRIALDPGEIPLIGRTTEQSMRSGALLGHAASVNGLLQNIDLELGTADGTRAPVVATGGWSPTLAPLVTRIDHLEARLVLDGLRIAWQYGQA